MVTLSNPFVLILHSSCRFSSSDNNHDRDELGPGADRTMESAAVMEIHRMLRQQQAYMPIKCDIQVLPEIPVEQDTAEPLPHHDSMRIDRQGLHPCGMENIVLLQELEPWSIHGGGFLLSLTACKATIPPFETTDGVLVLSQPLVLPIQPFPSTFSFELQQTDPDDSAEHELPSSVTQAHDIHVMSNPSRRAELHVVFDFTVAERRLGERWKDAFSERQAQLLLLQQQQEQQLKDDQPPADPVAPLTFDTPMNNEDAKNHCHSNAACSTSAIPSYDNHHHRVLLLIQKLAEDEARDLNRMLSGLGVIFILLAAIYVKIALPFLHVRGTTMLTGATTKRPRKNREIQRDKTARTLKFRCQLHNDDRCRDSNCPSLDEDDGVDGTPVREHPPVTTVTFPLTHSEARTPCSLEPMFSTRPIRCTKYGDSPFPSPPLSIDIGDSSSSVSHDSCNDEVAKDSAKLLPTHCPITKDVRTTVSPSRNHHGGQQKAPSSPPVLQSDPGIELSPCSKLVHHWMQSKGTRRVAHDPTKRSIMGTLEDVYLSTRAQNVLDKKDPTLGATERGSAVDANHAVSPKENTTCSELSLLTPPPLRLVFSTENKEKGIVTPATKAVITSKEAVSDAFTMKVSYPSNNELLSATPETCRTSESDESFLRDYWGD